MGKEVILKIDNVSKQYRLGVRGTGSISHDLNRWWHKIRGKEDPYLIVGEANDRTAKGESEYVWALRNINLELERGDILGIIGKNGAGKSTLLKILSKVTGPTTGSVKYNGRIASLLEVGTGFHPEMTGRENIYLNGTILGMTKKEISSKIDEIIEFSGCERYIDTPTKRYSSGMTVRLAFAVAAFLEPDIFVVDEVLAVGDVEFQKKAIGKMKDISGEDGRTVLFVSHNMAAVQDLCNKGMVLNNGEVQFMGGIAEAVGEYLKQYSQDNREVRFELKDAPGNDLAKFTYASVKGLGKDINEVIRGGDAIEMEFEFYVLKSGDSKVGLTFHLADELGTLVFTGNSDFQQNEVSEGYYRERVIIPKDLMHQGIYSVRALYLVENGRSILYKMARVIQFEIMPEFASALFLDGGKKEGAVKPKLEWEVIKKNERI
ncbi:MAG: ATP-binding cassette domain-containing protein [Flavobacteriales bacterium]|nr:ATP-binding cassette domain-containing protein [Flavobacteriales bacterium]